MLYIIDMTTYTFLGILIWIISVIVLLLLEDTITKKCTPKCKVVIETFYLCGKLFLSLLLAILPLGAVLLVVELIYTCLLKSIF